MNAVILAMALLLQAALPQQPPAPPQPIPKAEIQEVSKKLLTIKRIYVDSFGEDAISKQLQAMVIASLSDTKRFIITENKEKADAILRGTALEKTSQEFHSFEEGAAAGTASGGHSGSVFGSSGGFAARAMAAEDKNASTETMHDARIAVRLVAADGDVIWTTKQESKGGKYKGASADVADKVAKQLMREIEKLEKQSDKPPATTAP